MSWVYTIFFVASMVVGALSYYNAQTLAAANAQGEVAAISGNMIVYRSYVVSYAVANPAVTGAVADGSLGLPAWYNKNTALSNYVTGGKGYVYYAVPPGQLAYQLLKDTNNSIYAGVKQSGFVVNPLGGTSTIAVPAAIPDGSVVFAN